MRFGDAIDCDEDWLAEVARNAGAEKSGPRMWDAIARRLCEAMLRLEAVVNPAASVEGVSHA